MGSDLLDQTPIVDIKPYIQYSDSVPEARSGYAQYEPIRKMVIWSQQAQQKQENLLQSAQLTLQEIDELQQVLSLDPRPAYQNDEQRIYGMKFANLDVKFTVNTLQVEIVDL